MLSSRRWSKLKSSPIVSAATSAEISGAIPIVLFSYWRSIVRADASLELRRAAERVDRRIGGGPMRLHDAGVVPRQRVLPVHLHRLPIGGKRILGPAGLMQHHAALVPELGGIRDFAQQRVVQLERRREVALQEVELGHRLERETPVLPALQCQA